MLGSSILRILKKKGYKNLITVEKNLDLRNQAFVKKFLKKLDAVIIAAAKVGELKLIWIIQQILLVTIYKFKQI